MFPELFRIPGLGIPLATYGVLLAIGFILALWLAARLAARDGLPKQRIYDLGLYVLAAGLVGSKALMVITEWNDYGGDWRRMLSVDLPSTLRMMSPANTPAPYAGVSTIGLLTRS